MLENAPSQCINPALIHMDQKESTLTIGLFVGAFGTFFDTEMREIEPIDKDTQS
jgi:hypothetical protein